ncbi:Haloacid dehalogenase-like hydrolase family protein [Musa troglodytarum]|uniref:Haloacid dehalogenase-like hydrolase family protein n=1 Tax=Musa troglodytarum TaxID=320322 RepID=A0A9E7F3X1_9LILI|nr:Haloacid dehalogenase-like hydrolase family protein [Musa troglodytarum]
MKMEYEDRFRQVQRPKYDCLLFDLDDTLYPLSSGIASECLKNIGDYMVERLGIEERQISDLCNLLYKNYGTTMAGLRAIGYEFDYNDYHSFVHGRLPYGKLKPDPVLRHLLLSLPVRKVVSHFTSTQDPIMMQIECNLLFPMQIFTNADEEHAAEVLRKLGLEDCFQGIICFETLNPLPPSSSSDQERKAEVFDIVGHFSHPTDGVELPRTPVLCKPSVDAMEHALRVAGIDDPQRTMFFDDSVRNIQSGKRIGLHTVLVGTSRRIKGADHALESIHNMKEAFPELWEEGEKSELVLRSGKIGLETSAIA